MEPLDEAPKRPELDIRLSIVELERVFAALENLEERWGNEGACNSCGWHADLGEYDIDYDDILDALESKDGELWLPCLNKDIDGSGHKGVKVYIGCESGQWIAAPGDAGVSTKLYQSVVQWAETKGGEQGAILKSMWRGTPWIVNTYTGSIDDHGPYSEIMTWCDKEFGPMARPIHGRSGNWQSGSATINGWTWMGFATEEMMNKFSLRWQTEH